MSFIDFSIFGRKKKPKREPRKAKTLSIEHLEARSMLASSSLDLDNHLLVATSDATTPRQVEYLGRGVNASYLGSNKAYVSWRLLGTDPSAISFNIYRSTDGSAALKRNSSPITRTTDFTDTGVDASKKHTYFIKPIVNGLEGSQSDSFTIPAGSSAAQYKSVPMMIPPPGTTPAGETYNYSANDTSVGDVDGDGEYELIVKWDPSNSKDNSQSGYTGNVYIDAYKMDGTRLWRIDLGRNIRAGAHYTQFMVYDFNGDGKAEIAMKTAPGTLDGQGNAVLMGSDKVSADYRNSSGYVLSGPEYLTVFEGITGKALSTVAYNPGRGTVSSWGDSYGNRVDRFLAGVGYFDGVRPSLLVCRGYYTRTVLVAYDFRNGTLSQRWVFDTNSSSSLSGYRGQGSHSLNVADVDGDGKDEVVYGAMTVDHDGKPLYNTTWGHGDALHTADMDPNNPGLEVFMVHETESLHKGNGGTLTDAATGKLLFAISGKGDVGRGIAMDIDPRYPGYEMWTIQSGLYSSNGTLIQGNRPSFVNFGIWWDGDPLRELLNGTTISDWIIGSDGLGYRTNLVYPTGLSSNNGTKATPCLVADIYGDWREEVIWRKSDNTELQIWSTTTASQLRLPTLMHDTKYRVSVAWQNAGYNQPANTSYFIGQGMTIPTSLPVYAVKYNTAPKIASSGSTKSVITNGIVALSALATDDRSETELTYKWTLIRGPGSASFSSNNSNVAKNTTATITKFGVYSFEVVVTDAAGLSASSQVTATFAKMGDTNLDGLVDMLDIAAILSSGLYDTGGFAGWADGDFNGDGVVDVLDLSLCMSGGYFNT